MSTSQYNVHLSAAAAQILETAAFRDDQPPSVLASELLERLLLDRIQEENTALVSEEDREEISSAPIAMLHEVLWRQVYLVACQQGRPRSAEGHRALRETARTQSRGIVEQILTNENDASK